MLEPTIVRRVNEPLIVESPLPPVSTDVGWEGLLLDRDRRPAETETEWGDFVARTLSDGATRYREACPCRSCAFWRSTWEAWHRTPFEEIRARVDLPMCPDGGYAHANDPGKPSRW